MLSAFIPNGLTDSPHVYTIFQKFSDCRKKQTVRHEILQSVALPLSLAAFYFSGRTTLDSLDNVSQRVINEIITPIPCVLPTALKEDER